MGEKEHCHRGTLHTGWQNDTGEGKHGTGEANCPGWRSNGKTKKNKQQTNNAKKPTPTFGGPALEARCARGKVGELAARAVPVTRLDVGAAGVAVAAPRVVVGVTLVPSCWERE